MALIQWDSKLSVSVSSIDSQHQRLVKMINDLDDAMRAGKGKTVIGNIVDGLIGYTRTHFATEETYFDQFAYPDTTAHKREHADFIKKVGDFKQGYDQGKTLLSIEIMNFLSTWLRQHIQGTDRKYGPFLLSKGVS